MTIETSKQPSGLPFALGTYFIWGLIPLYFHLMRDVPPVELVGWRVLFTIPVCLILVALRREFGQVWQALRNPRAIGALTASALLIGANWLIYVIAIQQGHVFATSLGYYINPLMNVLAGTVFLGERLSRAQWFAVGLATIGVVILAWGAHDMLWISLALATSFAGYGLVRKLAPVESLPGLTLETLILAVPGIVLVSLQAFSPAGSSLGQSLEKDLLLAAAGIVTGVPLLLFAVAARRLPYSLLGFTQFAAPTIVFFVGLWFFKEPLNTVQLVCFGFIWAAIAVFSVDLLSASKRG